ncbi:ribonuclease HI [Mesorhizobium sp. M0664]|uniref:ribonuclease HI n=1 Tax=Mesorhizobium sp. M0664 TaxID=2956982 RepID=UPI00333696FE
MTDAKARHPGRHIVIHTDGACIGNPGPGGWAAILQSMDGPDELQRKAASGSNGDTTNNQMELTAAVEAVKLIKSDNPVFLRSDSQYVIKGITEWLVGWKAKGWKTAQRKPVLNRELWEKLEAVVAGRDITWDWVRGHNGDPLNEEVDRLANEAARSAKFS